MPHVPENFRPKPKFVPNKKAISTVPDLGVPQNMPPTPKPVMGPRKPRVRTLRKVSLREKPVSIADWDVPPARILQDFEGV